MSIRFEEAKSLTSSVVPVLEYPTDFKKKASNDCNLKLMISCSFEIPFDAWRIEDTETKSLRDWKFSKKDFEYSKLVLEISTRLNKLSRCHKGDADIWSLIENDDSFTIILDTTAISTGLFDFIDIVNGLIFPTLKSITIKDTGIVFIEERFDIRNAKIVCSGFGLNENGHVVAI